MDFLLDVLLDVCVDTLKLLPFLFVTYLIMEYFEDKAGDRITAGLERAGRVGPLIGSLFGALPQCGFSAAAASFYSGGVVTAGTLIAVFMSTSDEMLPIFISEAIPAGTIAKILMMKIVMGTVTGFAINFILHTLHRDRHGEHVIHDLCEREHCHCEDDEGGILKPALKHTFQIAIFIFVITFVAALLVDFVGMDRVASVMTERPVVGLFVIALIGLIPNCASSVLITQLYVGGLITVGQLMTGLLTGSGVGLLVLFRTNDRYRTNLKITAVLYVVGVAWGILITLTGITV